MAKTKSLFVCQQCAAEFPKWEGRCRECGSWNSLVEEIRTATSAKAAHHRGWSVADTSTEGSVLALDGAFAEEERARTRTGYAELDRVLGGGLVKGSYILLGGDPGIGKSTLLMQMAGGLAREKARVLYVSGEESVHQTALRAQRLGVRTKDVEVASESSLEAILSLAQKRQPTVLIVDSIQTVYLSELQAAPGSVSQVRECAARLMSLAKGHGIIVFLIGHVTKEGNIAGPKVLEHMVDTVLSFEGDHNHQFRLLRALKNRFGATNELGVFQMDSQGLVEVSNPSELFLEERGSKLSGSAVFAAMEGTRPLLCEVQALTSSSPLAMPRRTSIGFDNNRTHLLSAVLDKFTSVDLGRADLYVNVVGGLKLTEPAADLAVAAAVISSAEGIEINAKACFCGEIGLTGEIRAVSFVEERLREAQKLGFTHCVLPSSNEKHLRGKKGATPVWIRHISELTSVMQKMRPESGAKGSRRETRVEPDLDL